MNRSHATARVAGGEFQLLWHLATNNRVLSWLNLGVGGDYQDRLRLWQKTYVDTTPPSPPMLDDHHSSQVVGVYALAEAKVANRVVLSAGLRYDRTLGFVSALSPRAGAVWKATPSTVVKLLYGGSFRAPNAYERFFNMGPPVMMSLNPDLQPETIRTSELVLEQGLGTHLRALASGFMYDIKNLIVTTMQPDGWSVFTNAGRIKAYGAELEIEGKWNPIRARGSYSFKRTSASDMAGVGTGDSPMPNSPTHMAKLNLLGKSPWPWLNEAIEFQYLSRRQTPRSIMGTAPSVGAYVVTNLSLSVAPLSAFEATLTVRNLFNTKNSDPASLIHLQNAIPETGRTVWLRLAWKAL